MYQNAVLDLMAHGEVRDLQIYTAGFWVKVTLDLSEEVYVELVMQITTKPSPVEGNGRLEGL